jgi:hypothetical protein
MVGPGRTAATGCAIGATGSIAKEPGIQGDRITTLSSFSIVLILHSIKCAEDFAHGQIVAYIRAGRILIIQSFSTGRLSSTS